MIRYLVLGLLSAAEVASPQMVVSQQAPANVASADPMRHIIALNVSNVTAREAVARIEKESGLTFVYDVSILPSRHDVTINSNALTVQQALALALRGTSLR